MRAWLTEYWFPLSMGGLMAIATALLIVSEATKECQPSVCTPGVFDCHCTDPEHRMEIDGDQVRCLCEGEP